MTYLISSVVDLSSSSNTNSSYISRTSNNGAWLSYGVRE
jgi:hypothetical protein